MKDEMDILREVSSIAAAHGSIALSEMLQKKINLRLPNLETLKPEELYAKILPGKPIISVQCRILTGTVGNVIMIFDEKSAFELVSACYQEEGESRGGLTEVGVSVIKEVGNIVIGSYAGALSVILKQPIIPSIPTFISGILREAISAGIRAYEREEALLLIEAFFEEETKKIQGKFYFVLTPNTVKDIQEAAHRMLRTLDEV